MEKIGETLSHKNPARQFNYEELVRQIVEDPDVAVFIKLKEKNLVNLKFPEASRSSISTSVNEIDFYWG